MLREQKMLLRQLRRQAAEWDAEHGEGFAYAGPAGFVLEHGEWFLPRRLPDGYRPGLPGACYGVAIATAVATGAAYVEGFALAVTPEGPTALHHAWNADAGGLVDATWTGARALRVVNGRPTVYLGAPGLAYLGVRFLHERADDCTWAGNASVLDDHERGWPLLRSRWEGELATPAPSWTVSPLLLAWRAREAGDPVEMARQLELADRDLAS